MASAFTFEPVNRNLVTVNEIIVKKYRQGARGSNINFKVHKPKQVFTALSSPRKYEKTALNSGPDDSIRHHYTG
jgi:hypothetical protein